MPKIINEYAADNPFVTALQGFAGSFGKNTPQLEMYRQKAAELNRQNIYTPQLADAVVGTDPALTARLGILSGIDPKTTGGYRQYYGVQQYGPGSAEATRDTMSVPGANYGNTVQGTQAAEANRRLIEDKRTERLFDAERYKTDNTPTNILTPEGPRIGRLSQSFGQQPVLPQTQAQGAILQQDMPTLTPEQRARAGGYEPKSPANVWVYRRPDGNYGNTLDAKTDAQTGQPITGPAMKLEGPTTEGIRPTVAGELQRSDIQFQKFSKMLNMAREAAKRDPMNFGVAGFVKGTLQDVGQLGQNVSQGLGFDGINSALADTQQRAVKAGINPALMTGLFDPSQPELQTLSDLMVYSAAEALAGQKGQSVSDKDVTMFKGIMGDPREWMMSQQKYLAKLTQVERIIGAYRAVNEANLPPKQRPLGSTPAAQSADPLSQARDAISRGADRNAVIQRLQQNGIDPAGL